MGGKSSREATPRRHNANASHAQDSFNRRRTGPNSSNATSSLTVNGDNLRAPGASDSHIRQHRSNSARESGIRIARPGFEWFFAEQHLLSGASTSRNISRNPVALSQSLPPYLFRNNRDGKCPICNKMIPADDVEAHLVMCLTKPRVSYNEDILKSNNGECVICLEDLLEGEKIARLPCLCIYHKVCIDQWFVKSQTCPEHPPD